MEIRFTTAESWSTVPGLLYSRLREQYPTQRDLPLAQLPEDFRRNEPSVTYQPLIQFVSERFIIQFGPRVISLATKSNEYPGWSAFVTEMKWVISRVRELGFVIEGERLGVHYINFFDSDVFPNLSLRACVDESRFDSSQLSITTVMKRSPLTARLAITNSAIVAADTQPKRGSIVDVDVWLGSLDFDLFNDGLQKFESAHTYEKQIFFGLLKPEFTATLNPIYE